MGRPLLVFQGTLLLWSSFQIFIVLGQKDLSSYGIPEEPLITSETENERQAEEEHGGGGGHHHHHHGNPLDWLRESVPGEPDLDYPIFNTPPDTGFECGDKADGMYADVDARCQVWHQCFADRKWSFLCPNGTIFNQEIFTCVWWFDFECTTAASFYSLNDNLYEPAGGGSAPTGDSENREIEENIISTKDTAPARQPEPQPIQPAAKPRPVAPKPRSRTRPVAPKPQPQPSPAAPKARPQPEPIAPEPQYEPTAISPKLPQTNLLPEIVPSENVPDNGYASNIPEQPLGPALQPFPATPSSVPVPASIESNYDASDYDDRGTGINSDYDNAVEEGYNYRVPAPENQLIIERPKKRKKPTSRPQPTPRSDDGLDIEAPLPIYGAPPQPFDGGQNTFSVDILTPPEVVVEEEEGEDTLPGYLPPDPRQGRKSRNGRRFNRRGRGFSGFNKRRLRSINLERQILNVPWYVIRRSEH